MSSAQDIQFAEERARRAVLLVKAHHLLKELTGMVETVRGHIIELGGTGQVMHAFSPTARLRDFDWREHTELHRQPRPSFTFPSPH